MQYFHNGGIAWYFWLLYKFKVQPLSDRRGNSGWSRDHFFFLNFLVKAILRQIFLQCLLKMGALK